MIQVHNESLDVFKRKHISYEDVFSDYGTAGVIVRIGDKIQRLVSVSNRGITIVNTKMLRDILLDLHNYAAMAIISIDEDNSKISQTKNDQNFDLKIENLC
jgi:uncharacterized membrane-anchored protein